MGTLQWCGQNCRYDQVNSTRPRSRRLCPACRLSSRIDRGDHRDYDDAIDEWRYRDRRRSSHTGSERNLVHCDVVVPHVTCRSMPSLDLPGGLWSCSTLMEVTGFLQLARSHS
jgi:hypothetical protein